MKRPVLRTALLAAITLAAGVAVAEPAAATTTFASATLTSATLTSATLTSTTFTSTIVNQANNNCAAVPNGSGTSGVQLVQQSCTSGASQAFTFTPVSDTAYTVGTLTSGSCVDI